LFPLEIEWRGRALTAPLPLNCGRYYFAKNVFVNV
jgi:hypothetical protein